MSTPVLRELHAAHVHLQHALQLGYDPRTRLSFLQRVALNRAQDRVLRLILTLSERAGWS